MYKGVFTNNGGVENQNTFDLSWISTQNRMISRNRNHVQMGIRDSHSLHHSSKHQDKFIGCT